MSALRETVSLPDRRGRARPVRVLRLGPGEALPAAPECDAVMLADPGADRSAAMALVAAAGRIGCAAWVPISSLPVLDREPGAPRARVGDMQLVGFHPPAEAPLAATIAARALAGLLLLGLLPLLLLLAAAVWAGNPGPVLFFHDRVGRHGRPFRMLKLRTLRRVRTAQSPGDTPSGLLKPARDPRATLVGRFLRGHSLDELPQLWHVLSGEMAFVGPRPLPASDLRHATQPWHHIRERVRPGLTGLWQVAGRNRVSFDDLCVLDACLVHNRCGRLVRSILARTIPALWNGEGR